MASAAHRNLRRRARSRAERVGHARFETTPGTTSLSTVAIVALAALAVLAACGGSDSTDASTPTAGSTARTQPLAAPTERIIPLDGDLAEIVFALGLGDRVVATDISATYPAEADALPEIGYQRALAAEPILAFEPTMVLATDLAGPPETLTALDDTGVEVVMIDSPSSPDGPAAKIRGVAAALGVPEAGDALAREVEAGIAGAIERAATATTSPRVLALYVRGENVQLVLGRGSGIDWILESVGVTDVADELGVVETAQITAEAVAAAAPEVFIVPETGLQSVGGIDGLLEIPGLAGTPAGRDRRVLAYDDQYLLGNGPRTPALLEQLITDLHPELA